MLVLYVLLPRRTSGARYHKVTTSLEKVLTGMPKARARPKSAKFQQPLAINEEILRFKIAMQDAILVAKVDAFEQLIHEAFDSGWLEGLRARRVCPCISSSHRP